MNYTVSTYAVNTVYAHNTVAVTGRYTALTVIRTTAHTKHKDSRHK